MAIDIQKFIGRSKKENPTIDFTTSEYGGELNQSHGKSLVGIKIKIVEAKDILKGTLAVEKANFKDQKRDDEELKRKEDEEELETPADTKKSGLKMPPMPGASFLERVKTFIGTILLGFAITKLLKFLPKLKGLLKLLAGIAEWIIGVGSLLLKGLVALVDWGYKAYDWTRGAVHNVFGDKGVAVFDKVAGVLNKTLNLIMGVGLAMIALSNHMGGGIVNWGKGFMSIFKHGLKRAIPRLLIKMFGKKTAASILGKSVVTKGVVTTATGATGATTVGAGTGAVVTTGATKVAGVAVGTKIAIAGSAGLLASGLGEGMFQLKKLAQKREEEINQNFKEKSWLNPMKYFDGAALLGAKFNSYILGVLGVILDIVGTPFRYLIELIRYPFLDKEGKEKQRKNLAKFDARIREQFREMVHAFSLGTLAKDKGAFGSLYGKQGTDAMGYTKDGKTKSRQGAIQAGMLLLSTPDLVATQDLLSGKPSGEMVHTIEEVIKGGRKVDFKGLDKTASYEDGSDTTVYATVPREKVDGKQDMKDQGIETTGLNVGGGGSSDSYADFLYKKAG